MAGSHNSAGDVGGGAAVPLPPDWPGLAADAGGVDVRVDMVEWVSRDLRTGVDGVSDQSWRPPELPRQGKLGQLRGFGDQSGVWSTGRDVLHVDAQLRDRVEAFYSVVLGSLGGVAQRLQASAEVYRGADERSAVVVDGSAAAGVGGGASGVGAPGGAAPGGAAPGGTAPSGTPLGGSTSVGGTPDGSASGSGGGQTSVVGPDGRF